MNKVYYSPSEALRQHEDLYVGIASVSFLTSLRAVIWGAFVDLRISHTLVIERVYRNLNRFNFRFYGEFKD